ncbi:hypothetical protein LJB42_000191 [Komagataella kurtzmanii]|nr:hypothetical protein LJB42_000191 [Komagataella kurtzmanii]
MSDLQRRLLSPSGKTKGGGSRGSSRSHSRVSTPGLSDDEDSYLNNDLDFNQLDELLAKKLGELSVEPSRTSRSENPQSTSPNSSKKLKEPSDLDQVKRNKEITNQDLYSTDNLISSLTSTSRTQVSQESRELLLAQLFNLYTTSSRYQHTYDEFQLEQLIRVFINAKTENEKLFALKCGAYMGAIDTKESSQIIVDEFLPLLKRDIIVDDDSVSVTLKANYIMAFSSLLLVVMDGSGCYGIEENSEMFLEVIEGQLNSKNASTSIVVNSLQSVGIILTLIYSGRGGPSSSLNDYLIEIAPRVVAVIDHPDFQIQLSATKLIGLIYELFDYDEGNEDEEEYDESEAFQPSPYHDEEILYSLRELYNKGNKKTSKRDKSDTKSVFKDVIQSIEYYLNQNKEPDRLQDIYVLPTLTRLKISRTKSYEISSWFTILRVSSLRYLFGAAFHTQLLRNANIKKHVFKPSFNGLNSGSHEENFDDIDDDEYGYSSSHSPLSDKKKTQMLQKKRSEKARERVHSDFVG